MAYRKQLKDKNGNVVYPDVGVLGASNIADGAITNVKIADSAVTSDKIDSATYSTEEQVVGTWINGKPLYRKVVPFGALPNNTYKEIQLNGTGAAYIRIVKIDAYMTTDNPMQTYARPIPYNDGSTTIGCYWSEYIFRITTNTAAYTSFNANIIEYYWKTTD
jgi:hypothetical protein